MAITNTSTPKATSIGDSKIRFGPDGRDRRRRPRESVTLPVHIRGKMGSFGAFEDDGTTIDASLDGLLVATNRGGYRSGQLLEIAIVPSGEMAPLVTSQSARVLRSVLMPNQVTYAVALEYLSSTMNFKSNSNSTTALTARRAFPRYRFFANADLIQSPSTFRLTGRVTEISRNGCFVDSLSQLPLDMELNLRICRGAETFATSGKIIYVRPWIGMGVVFLDPPKDQREILESWLARLPSAWPSSPRLNQISTTE
jgi:hypothetical protein